MEYEKIKEWLDKLVRNLKEAQELENFNSQIMCCCPCTTIQIYKGIDIIADVMGIELNVEKGWHDEYPFRYSFVYDGIVFSQIGKERLGKHAGTD
jgi:hypothetical protein